MLRSRRSFTHGIAGEHPSIRRGASPEFADYKPYTPGDDFRRVDWNIYARMGEMFVRLSEVSIDLTVHLLLDTSESMNFGTPNKFMYAKQAAAAFGYLSLAGFDRVAVAPFAAQPGRIFGPTQGRSRAAGLFQYLHELADHAGGNRSCPHPAAVREHEPPPRLPHPAFRLAQYHEPRCRPFASSSNASGKSWCCISSRRGNSNRPSRATWNSWTPRAGR